MKASTVKVNAAEVEALRARLSAMETHADDLLSGYKALEDRVKDREDSWAHAKTIIVRCAVDRDEANKRIATLHADLRTRTAERDDARRLCEEVTDALRSATDTTREAVMPTTLDRWALLSQTMQLIVADLDEANEMVELMEATISRERSDRVALEADNSGLRDALVSIAWAAGVEWGEDVADSTQRVIAAATESKRWATELEDDADAFTRRRLALQRLATATFQDVDVVRDEGDVPAQRVAGRAEAYGHAADIIRATIARLRATR